MTSSLVNFGVWVTDGRDAVRRKRLALGYVIGLTVSGALIAAVIANSRAIAAEREEDIMDVQLATQPEPEPEPQPQPEAKKPPPRPKLQTPFEIPTDKPKEVTPTKADSAYGDDAFEKDQEPEPVKPPPVVKEEPKPPPKAIVAPKRPTGPIQITENVTPPVAISNPTPEYPASAKADGIQGTVVVKYVVTESGAVTNIEVVRGPAELRAAVLAAMRGWRFRPAMLDGHPVAVSRVHRFPFRIKT